MSNANAVLPKPPMIHSKSNQAAQSKIDKLYAAAKDGGLKAVEAIKTNAVSRQTYVHMAHAYKCELILALGGKVPEGQLPVAKPAKAAKDAQPEADSAPKHAAKPPTTPFRASKRAPAPKAAVKETNAPKAPAAAKTASKPSRPTIAQMVAKATKQAPVAKAA